jgi:uncharacterized protein YcsI (UPF0317 family)
MRLRHPPYNSSLSQSRVVRFVARDTETTVYSVASPGLGYVQGNSVALLRELAADFFLLAQRSPKSRVVIGLSQPGSRSIAAHSEDFEIVAGIPRYLA